MNYGRYPAARATRFQASSGPSESFERVESSGEVTVGDTQANLWTFSGWPDQIDIIVRANPVTIVLLDDATRELARFVVQAGAPYQTQIRAHTVAAFNTTAGSAAKVCVLGKWSPVTEDPYADRDHG
jgi:hypothetical protein